MNRIGVIGASGRTGSHVVEALAMSTSSKLCAAIVSPQSSRLGQEVMKSGIRFSSDLKSLAECDGVIDFSIPPVSIQVAQACSEMRKPLVVATTGFSVEERKKVENCARAIPLCIASNTSLGATALAMASVYLQKILGVSFDVEVMEIHHRMKRDAPSGTAKTIINGLAGKEHPVVFGREGQRTTGEIGVVSLRGGDVPGDHTVYFLGDGERLEVSHRAQNRSIFGKGAVVLIERLIGLSPGVFTVEGLLRAPD